MTTSLVRTRHATADDLAAVHDLYRRCSPRTLESRFHAPVDTVPVRLVRRLLQPEGGWSLLAEQGSEVVGHGVAGPVLPSTVEVGLLVDDAFQGTGVGSRLVRDLAAAACARGFTSMVCSVEPDNESVLPTVRKAGLGAVPSHEDGILEIHLPLRAACADLRRPA
jgi:ribosomal protein S18 acetylase RimI-like enzyme